MPLPPANSGRKLKHTRDVHIEVYARDDGLWDIDARLTDTKTYDIGLANGSIPAGRPVHDIWLRLTVDLQSTIVDIEVFFDFVPFKGFCDTIGPAYKKMIGLNLLSGFRQGMKERLSGVEGCIHLNELAMILPTVAIQSFSFGDMENRADPSGEKQDQKPFELDNCHALRTDGAAVAIYYPRWAVKPNI